MAIKTIANHHTKRWILFGVFIIVVVVAVIVLKDVTKPKAVSGPIKTISTNTNSTNRENSASSQPQTVSQSQKTSTVSQSVPGGALLAPYGQFVSNHRPGQNGSNLTEASQCVTTPGAVCYIKFTQDNVVKTLPIKTADSDGSVFWEWNVNDAGLTSGKWGITASATLNGQTKTTTDQLVLEIQ